MEACGDFSGHGISKERIQRAFELGKKWFQLSNEEKSQYKLDLTEYVGWKGERLLLNSDGATLNLFCSPSFSFLPQLEGLLYISFWCIDTQKDSLSAPTARTY